MNKLFMLFCAMSITACSSYGQIPRIDPIAKPDYAINHVDHNASNSDLAKAIAISWKQCNNYADKMAGLINASQI